MAADRARGVVPAARRVVRLLLGGAAGRRRFSRPDPIAPDLLNLRELPDRPASPTSLPFEGSIAFPARYGTGSRCADDETSASWCRPARSARTPRKEAVEGAADPLRAAWPRPSGRRA